MRTGKIMTRENTVRVRARVTAGARTEKCGTKDGQMFDIVVKEKAERGAANGRVQQLIARHFGVSTKAVQIVTGHRRKNKTLKVVQ